MSAVGTAVVVDRPRATLSGWRWFSVLAAMTSAIELCAWRLIDWDSARDVESLLGFNWRLSAPYFLLTFLASPLQQLAPSRFSRWLLANRRYTGLAFASVAGWQLASILSFAWRFPTELVQFHDNAFQFVEDSIFIAIIVMSATSFRVVNRHMSAVAWRRVHKTGLYLLAGLLTANNFFYSVHRSDPAYLVITGAFGIIWSLRAWVWWRHRRTLSGWPLFWALAGVVNAAVLGAWSFYGVESAPAMQRMLALCTGLAAATFLPAFAARPLRRLARGAASQWLYRNQPAFLLTSGVALAWYLGFIGLHRMASPRVALLPLPLAPAIALGGIAVVLLPLAFVSGEAWRARLPRAARGTAETLPLIVLALVASYGLVAAGVSELTLTLSAAFVAVWLLRLAALLWPTGPEPDDH